MKTHYRKNSFLPLTAALALLVNHAKCRWRRGCGSC